MEYGKDLTYLYDYVLPAHGYAVWKFEFIREMDKVNKKIDRYNETVLHGRVQDPETYLRILEPGRHDSLQLISSQKEIRIAQLSTELSSFGPGKLYKSIDIFGNHHDQPIQDKISVLGLVILTLVIAPYIDIAHEVAQNVDASGGTKLLWTVVVREAHEHTKMRACCKRGLVYTNWQSRWVTAKSVREENRRLNTLEWEGSTHGPEFTAFGICHSPSAAEQAEDERLRSQWKRKRDVLTGLIHKHADKLQGVDQILCFGLGPLDQKRPKSFVQHLAAVTIRDTLHDIRSEKGVTTTIPIIAQDPLYCLHCKLELQKELEIRAVTDQEGFLAVTKNSIVITVAPGAPVCQIIADITVDDGGPLALLCNSFNDDYLAQEREPRGHYTTDEPTKNMVAYKNHCTVESFDDTELVLGMTYQDFEKRFEFPARIRQKLLQAGSNLDTNENINPQDRHRYDESVRMWKLESEIDFGNLALHVKAL